jgi:ADP-ribose pyrophosphatase YjhB (NUDIX family)
MNISNFNIRVYGILSDADGRILVSHERIKKQAYAKFPGGGLEYGEGLKDGLIREFQEELNLNIGVGELLFITDFFIQSAFKGEDQLVSVYYSVYAAALGSISTVDKWPSPEFVVDKKQLFQWINPSEIGIEQLNFPGDKAMLHHLLDSY